MKYRGFRIDRIFEDEGYEKVIGYDVVDPKVDPDGLVPIAEMISTIEGCRQIIREEVRYRSTFGWVLR